MASDGERWHLFCKVVDNYGDAGVAWRLARQLVAEHGKNVRLVLADLETLAKIRPEVDPRRDIQELHGVEIARAVGQVEPERVADVVVETFGCDPPEAYVLAMAQRKTTPRWLNLEYLSAEEWVEGSHTLPSPHPRLPLVKHFFFPGFTERTGGLLREAGLFARRDAFRATMPKVRGLRASVFAYPSAPLPALMRTFNETKQPVEAWVPGMTVDFVDQDRYDEMLWSCDVNFVRGEDSFVRAQWAGRPFVWHIYPTEDGAHWKKLTAFLARYTEGMDREDALAVSTLWGAWNRGGNVGSAWHAFADRLPSLEAHAQRWAAKLGARRDLAAGIVDFADRVLK
ncbi:hypothetical protein BWI17_11830 [Betaproteobacteria bacterium GR16-43]|nr:hypothetical protein BWI17_11830 [Betaproteobacteria bacterium GR16-43]